VTPGVVPFPSAFPAGLVGANSTVSDAIVRVR
jgi:hypothetical protein